MVTGELPFRGERDVSLLYSIAHPVTIARNLPLANSFLFYYALAR
jgi:hypothetical protein